jgi:hypothetical protein
MVDFGPEQGLSDFETGGVTGYVEDLKRAKTQLWAKRCRLWIDAKLTLLRTRLDRMIPAGLDTT